MFEDLDSSLLHEEKNCKIQYSDKCFLVVRSIERKLLSETTCTLESGTVQWTRDWDMGWPLLPSPATIKIAPSTGDKLLMPFRQWQVEPSNGTHCPWGIVITWLACEELMALLLKNNCLQSILCYTWNSLFHFHFLSQMSIAYRVMVNKYKFSFICTAWPLDGS